MVGAKIKNLADSQKVIDEITKQKIDFVR